MKRPIFVRPLSDAERESLEAGLHSPDAFTLRRCQILLASHRGENAYQIAHQLGRKPHATPSTPSTTKGCRRPSSRDRSIRTPFIGPSIPNRLRPCGRCSTALRGSLAVRVASGVWRWRQRLPLRRDSSKGRSLGRPSGLLLCAFSESGGRERNAGSPLPTPLYERKRLASLATD